MYDVLKLLHPRVREPGEQILHAILCGRKILDWDRFLRINVDERPVEKSNLVDLLNYLLYPYDSGVKKPKGYNKFLRALSTIKLEPTWLENEEVRSELEEMLEELEESTESETDQDEQSEEEEHSEAESETESEEENEEESEERNGLEIEDRSGIEWEEFKLEN